MSDASTLKELVAALLTATADSDGYNKSLDEVSSELEKTEAGSPSTSLARFVEALGPTLTSSDDYKRAKAVEVLSDLVQRNPSVLRDASRSKFLLEFFVERIHDQQSVAGCLKGICALLRQGNLHNLKPSELRQLTVKTAETIFSELTLQSHPQPVRHMAYSIFDYLMGEPAHCEALQSKDDFARSFANMMDGEKDPRNLLLCFKLVVQLLHSFNLAGDTIDALFDVTFCYFPITFRANQDDPYGITTEDLKIALRKCLVGHHLLGPLVMPLVLEKLSSASIPAKRDSLEVLVHGIPVFGAEFASVHVNELWELLKLEIFECKEDDIQELSLAALKVLTSNVSKSTSAIALTSLLDKVVSDMVSELQDLETKNARLVGKICEAVVSASDPCATRVARDMIPDLLNRLSTADTTTRKRVILETIDCILSGCKILYNEIPAEGLDEECLNPVVAYKDRLLELCRSASFASKEYVLYRKAGITGLKHLCDSRNVLSDIEISLVMRNLTQLLLTPDSEDPEVMIFSVSVLEGIINSPRVPTDSCIQCVDTLFEAVLTTPQLMDTISILGKHKKLFTYTLDRLLQIQTEASVVAISKMVDRASADVLSHIGLKLCQTFIHRADKCVPSMLAKIVRSLSDQDQRQLSTVLQSDDDVDTTVVAIIGNFRQEVAKDLVNESCMIEMVVKSGYDEARTMVVVSLLNKIKNDEEVTSFAERFLDGMELLNSEEKIKCFFWITKALIIRSHPIAWQLLDRLLSTLLNPEFGSFTAKCISNVLSDHPLILTKDSFSKIQPLFKQRFFMHIKPKIVVPFSTLSVAMKSHHLVIMSGLLRDLPRQVILHESSSILPLLFESIRPNQKHEETVQLSTLETLYTLLQSSVNTLDPHVTTLVPSLLALCVPPATLPVRLEALKTLACIPQKLIYEHLHPLKRKVIKGIEEALDDRKRVVRREAVRARGAWESLSAK